MIYLFKKYSFIFPLLLFVVISIPILYSELFTWNLNKTIGWGFDITNFVYWIPKLIQIFSIIYTIGYFRLYRRNQNGKTRFIFLNLIFLFLSTMEYANIYLVILFLVISIVGFVCVIITKESIKQWKVPAHNFNYHGHACLVPRRHGG